MIRIKLLTLIIYLSMYSLIFAGNKQFRFEYYSTENGLSNNDVYCMHQDKKGFIWFGTREGLNRFDGINFEVFQHIPFDQKSLSDNYITCITEDDSLNLWIGTANGGLNKYNLLKNSFVHFKHISESSSTLSHNGVWALLYSSDKKILIGTENGLDILDPATKQITHHLRGTYILSITQESNNKILIGTGVGVYEYNILQNTFSFKFESGVNGLTDNRVWTIYKSSNDSLWFGTQNGLTLLNKQDSSYTHFLNNRSTNSISHNFIVPLLNDSKKNFWIGTIGGGINLLIDNKFQKYNFNTSGKNRIWDIKEDKSGCIWFCTNEGIFKLNYNTQVFKQIKFIYDKPFPPVTLVQIDSKKNILVGTKDQGLKIFITDPVDNSLKIKKSVLDKNEINSILESGNNYWVGTSKGLFLLNSKFKIINHFVHSNSKINTISNDRVTSIVKDKYGLIWIGTYEGLNRFEPSTGNFKRYYSNNRENELYSDIIITMLKDSENNIWLGTQNGGVSVLNPESETFKTFLHNSGDITSISHNYVRTIFEDSEKNIWIGSYGGLNLFNKKNNSFKHYLIDEGLSNNVINSIQEDHQKNFWISTNNGLNKFITSDSSFKNYFVQDGLTANKINSSASYKPEKEIYLGTEKGLTIFSPIMIKNNLYQPEIIISTITNLDSTFNYFSSFNEEHIIEIPYNKNHLTINFFSTDFSNPSKIKYQYKLDGFDKNWNITQFEKQASYMNLPEDDYTFLVKGTNSSGIWNNKIAKVKISVVPPFWKSFWFLLTLAVVVSLVVLSFIYIRFRNILNIERIRTNIASDLHDSIGTNLTEITMLSNLLLSQKQEAENSQFIEHISESSLEAIDDINDIVWLIKDNSETDLRIILNRITKNFEEIFLAKQINFICSNPPENSFIKINIDQKRNLYFIIKEILNNSLKHSNANKIKLNTEYVNSSLSIFISDNGKGFDVDNHNEGNGLGNIRRRINRLNGEINFSSDPTGTKIKFTFKLKR